MHFLETNSFNVRTSVFHLTSEIHKLEFLLFPMVHIGEPEYYSTVKDKLSKCHFILYEGVKASVSRSIGLSYRLMVQKKDYGLITQSQGLELNSIGPEIIHADISEKEFDNEWSKIPLKTRLFVFFMYPLIGFFVRFLGKKVLLSEGGDVVDLPSERDLYDSDDPFKNLILSKRDSYLLAEIEKQFLEKQDMPVKIAILYGAKHMPAVSRLLMGKYGYKVVKAEWIKVADL